MANFDVDQSRSINKLLEKIIKRLSRELKKQQNDLALGEKISSLHWHNWVKSQLITIEQGRKKGIHWFQWVGK